MVVIERRRDRGKSTRLRLHVDGRDVTRHTIAETETAIVELVGLPLPALLASAFMVQNESDALMTASPAERKDILHRLFGLERYESLLSDAQQESAKSSAACDNLARECDRLADLVAERLPLSATLKAGEEEAIRVEKDLEDETAKMVALRERAAVLRDRALRAGELEQQIRAANAELDILAIQTSELDQDEAKKRQSAALPRPPFSPAELTKLDRDIDAAEATVHRLNEEVAFAKSLHAEIERDTRAVKVLGTVPCEALPPFAGCPFIVDTIAAKDKLPNKQRAWEAARDKAAEMGDTPAVVSALNAKKMALLELQGDLRVWEEAQRHVTDWLAKLPGRRAALEKAAAKAREVVTSANAERMRILQESEEAAQVAIDLNDLAERVTVLNGSLEQLQRSLADLRTREALVKEAETKLASDQEQLEEQRRRAHLFAVLTRALSRDGAPLMVLESGLPLIEERANELLARMPGSNAVSLVTQRETKSGTTRDTLDVIVSTGGIERPYQLFSGGERFRIDFALRVALASVLSHRTGARFETLWIDEGFGSQDPAGRDALLESLSAVADDFGLIVVVSHLPELTDRFPMKLVVTKTGDVSEAILEAA